MILGRAEQDQELGAGPVDDDHRLLAESHARLLVRAQEGLPDRAPAEAASVLETGGAKPLAVGSARSIAAAIAAGSSGSARTAASPLASSSDGCDGHDDGAAGRHRLQHRDPEALEARRVDRRRRAAVEARELGVRHEPEPADPVAGELGLLAPALAAGDREQEVAAEQLVGLDERLEVLARLERRDGEEVRRAEVGRRPVGRELGPRRRMSDVDTPLRHAEHLDDVAARVLGVHEDEVAGLGRVPVLARRASTASGA